MSTLIVTLPAPPTPERPDAPSGWRYVLSHDGRQIAAEGQTSAAALPRTGKSGDELVVVVPARALSWHRIDLPKGMAPGSPRLRAVLEGLLEDRLLDEPASLHFAIDPAARAGGTAWVAVCDRQWLGNALRSLEAADRSASRVVPEFAPGGTGTTLQALGEGEDGQLVVSAPSGVTMLPLSAAGVALVLGSDAGASAELPEDLQVWAEPGVATLAEQLLQRPVALQTAAQRALLAAQSRWDLAQFDLASSGRSRAVKRLQGGWRAWLQAPQWRAARWGAIGLLLINLVGLNAWAWKEQRVLQAKRDAIRSVLTQTFPAIKVVIDAPLQMEREVAAMRQTTGSSSGRDLESILAALGPSVPAERSLSAIEFAAGEARLRGLDLGEEQVSIMATNLQVQGLAARAEADSVVIRAQSAAGAPATPNAAPAPPQGAPAAPATAPRPATLPGDQR